jgi:hypothetical protein
MQWEMKTFHLAKCDVKSYVLAAEQWRLLHVARPDEEPVSNVVCRI